jgi:hypothetical protein
MLAQSRLVAMDTDQKNEIENVRFLLAYDEHKEKVEETISKLDAAALTATERQRKDAQPIPHRYALLRAGQAPAK